MKKLGKIKKSEALRLLPIYLSTGNLRIRKCGPVKSKGFHFNSKNIQKQKHFLYGGVRKLELSETVTLRYLKLIALNEMAVHAPSEGPLHLVRIDFIHRLHSVKQAAYKIGTP